MKKLIKGLFTKKEKEQNEGVKIVNGKIVGYDYSKKEKQEEVKEEIIVQNEVSNESIKLDDPLKVDTQEEKLEEVREVFQEEQQEQTKPQKQQLRN